MDTICGVGLPELILLLLLGFVVIGPERAQGVALQAGRALRTVMRSGWWGDFQQITNAIQNLPTTLVRMAELEEELEETQADFRNAMAEINDATRLPTDQRIGGDILPTDADAITDPWGIANAASETEFFPRTETGEESASDGDVLEDDE